jgi:hypothetical protein
MAVVVNAVSVSREDPLNLSSIAYNTTVSTGANKPSAFAASYQPNEPMETPIDYPVLTTSIVSNIEPADSIRFGKLALTHVQDVMLNSLLHTQHFDVPKVIKH